MHNHSAGCIALAGDPIGIMSSSNPYMNMGEVNSVVL